MVRRSTISTKGSRLWQGIPAIERAANGRLWAAFFSGGPKEPDPANYVLLTTSADDGLTWEEPRRIVDPPGRTRAYDPALWHDPAGRLWLFYNQANQESAVYDVWALIADDATSPEPRWSAPRRIELGVPFAFRLNKPTVLLSGEWLLPVTWARSAPQPTSEPRSWFAGESQLQGVAISTDGGESWALHGAVEAPYWALENMIIQLRDERLAMLIRTGSGLLWQAFSIDGGRVWSTGRPTSIVNPGARFFMRRLASGRALLINTPDPQRRQGLYAYLSDPADEMSFGPGLELDPRDKVSYPDAVQAPDGRIYAIHDCDRGGAGEILLDVFSEQEIDQNDKNIDRT